MVKIIGNSISWIPMFPIKSPTDVITLSIILLLLKLVVKIQLSRGLLKFWGDIVVYIGYYMIKYFYSKNI